MIESQDVSPRHDAPQTEPSALKGPIHLETFFFRVSKDPMLVPLANRRRRPLILYGLILLGTIGLYLFYKDLMYWTNRNLVRPGYGTTAINEGLWYFSLPCWVFIEAIYGMLGFMIGSGASKAWQRSGRLAELMLTPLRPLRIVQIMFVRSFRQPTILIVALLSVFSCVWFRVAAQGIPIDLRSIIPYMLLAFHAVVILVSESWSHMALSLGIPNRVHWLRSVLLHYFSLLLCFMPLLLFGAGAFALYIFLDQSPLWPNFTMAEFDVAFILFVTFGPAMWVIRIGFAWAFAKKLETTVFPQLDL